MNLDALFRDFEARLAAHQQQLLETDAKETRVTEFAKVTHLDRLAGSIERQVLILTNDDRKWNGILESVGLGWVQLRTDTGSVLIPLTAMLWWEAEVAYATVDTGQISRKLSFAFALRAISRTRVGVKAYLAAGHEIEGKIERVGADFIEIKTSFSAVKSSSSKVHSRVIPLNSVSAIAVTN